MNELNNPFVTYGYKGTEYFCDRKAETERVTQGLHNERNITLIAPRRIGKTGLIHHVFANIKATQPDVCCLYIDIFATKNLEQFVQLLARAIIGRLDSPTQSALRKVSEFFSSFRPTMSFDARTGDPVFSLDIVPSQEEQSLQRIFEYIRLSGKRCYIAFDEFQRITDYPETDMEALLRSYIQFLPNVYFIFAGSQHHLMEDMFLSAKRPFYQSSQMVILQEIEEKEYHAFASRFFKAKGSSLSYDVFHHLYSKVDGQTWYVQAILNRIYAMMPKAVTIDDVDAAVNDLVDEQEVAFENYYTSLTANQSALLRAIAKEQCVKTPMARSFIMKYRLPALSSIKTALKALVDRQLVYQYQGHYIVYDRFFGIWLRMQI
jgi:AAA+ ATPase superfamily predicted ATPase